MSPFKDQMSEYDQRILVIRFLPPLYLKGSSALTYSQHNTRQFEPLRPINRKCQLNVLVDIQTYTHFGIVRRSTI